MKNSAENRKMKEHDVTLRFPYLTHRTNQFRKLKYSRFCNNFNSYLTESTGAKFDIAGKYRELADKLGEDVWLFQGYHPPKGNPVELAEKLARIVFLDDEKKREKLRAEAEEFFSSIKAIDLVNGILSGVDRSFESILTLIRENAGLSKRKAGSITGFGRISFYRWENENNKINQGVDKVEKICEICLVAGPQKVAVINKYWEKNDKIALGQIVSAKSTSDYITGLINLAHFTNDEKAAKKLGVSRRTILDWKKGEFEPTRKENNNALALLVRSLEKKYPIIDGTSYKFLKNVSLLEDQQERYWGDIIAELRSQLSNMDRAELLNGIKKKLGEDFGGSKKFSLKAIARYENRTIREGHEKPKPVVAQAILDFFKEHEKDERIRNKEKYIDLEKELKEKFDEIGVFASPKTIDSKRFYKKITNQVLSGEDHKFSAKEAADKKAQEEPNEQWWQKVVRSSQNNSKSERVPE